MRLLSPDLVIVLPATSVAEQPRVLSSSRAGLVKVLDDHDYEARKLIAKETQRTYRLIESRFTGTGQRGSDNRWWVGRTIVVCKWIVPRPSQRDQVLLARFSKRWLASDLAGLATAIRQCAVTSQVDLPDADVRPLLEAARSGSFA